MADYLYGTLVNKAGVRMRSCAEEFSLRPLTPAHADDLFHDDTMSVGVKTCGELHREWVHRALDEWFDRMKRPAT